ncbi:MAG: hypothetical protein J7M06_00970, partial [Proteobacteria bacterium]|nr:hypothetical protein [Pseudomonadota bacterium]
MKMKINFVFFLKCLLFLSLFCQCSYVYAEEPVGWKDLGLFGGQMHAIAVDPVAPNILFAGSYYGDGLFKSSNGGENWESVEGFRNELVCAIAFTPDNHNTIWVATAYLIYKSEDGGLNWSFYDPALDHGCYYYYTLTIDPQDSNTVYIGTSGLDGSYDEGSIYKTTDNGETWQKTSLIADHNVWDIAVNPQNHQEIWAVTGPDWVSEGSIYRSPDGGATWIKVQTSLSEGWFDFVAINPQNSTVVFVGGKNGIFRTNDGGTTWSQLEPDRSCRALALDPENPDVVYAGWYDSELEDTVFSKSIDGGNSWSTHSIYPLELLCLSVNPENSQVLYGGDGNLGVSKSNDGGENWHPVNQGIKANHVFASASSPGGKLLIGSESGIYMKNEEGNWEGLMPFQGRAVAFSPVNENIIYAGFEWGIAKSLDSGQNWSFVFIPSDDANRVSSITINPQDPENLFLGVFYSSGNQGEIYKSTD